MKDEDDILKNESDGEQEGPFNRERNEEQERQHQEFLDKLRRMSDEAEANAEGKQGAFDFSDETDEEPISIGVFQDAQNPEEAYDLYYAIRRMLMRGLPSGEENRELRQMVYDEKNLFLRSGIARPLDGRPVGADSRQGFLSLMRDSYVVTQNWARRGGSPYDIFQDYYDLNKKMNYR
jgi:hypothetical protein